jgi:hypothetical protein
MTSGRCSALKSIPLQPRLWPDLRPVDWAWASRTTFANL